MGRSAPLRSNSKLPPPCPCLPTSSSAPLSLSPKPKELGYAATLLLGRAAEPNPTTPGNHQCGQLMPGWSHTHTRRRRSRGGRKEGGLQAAAAGRRWGCGWGWRMGGGCVELGVVVGGWLEELKGTRQFLFCLLPRPLSSSSCGFECD
jgi:hypothetical protein